MVASGDKKEGKAPAESSQDVANTSDVDNENGTKDKKIVTGDDEQLSEEDLKLKTDLELLVQTLKDKNESKLYKSSLDQLKEFIKNSTSSMTAVPKPLKFLRPSYPDLCKVYDSWTDKALKSSIADVLSVLAMTYSDDGKHDSLRYRMLSDYTNIESWGHEYIRHLALEIGEIYNDKIEKEAATKESNGSGEEALLESSNDQEFEFNKDEILQLSLDIVPYFLKHNAEADAVDLLLEIESIDKLPQFVDENTFERVCEYMIACVPLLPPPEDLSFLQTAFSIYLSQSELTRALSLAIRLDDESLIRSVFDATSDPVVHQQLGYILSFHKIPFEFEKCQDMIGNTNLSSNFLYATKELNLTTPKVPEDVYKSHLDNSKSLFAGTGLDSAQQNLAASFVNGFLNLGYCKDKLVVDNDNWVYKTKGDGMTSSVATIGSIYQWNLDGLQELDKYLYVDEPEIKAGALLGIGISACGVHDGSVEPALLLLQDYVTNPDSRISSAAILGLAISFAGTKNEEVLSLLLPIAADTSLPIETSVMAALALSHIFVGTCNGDITASIIDNFLERTTVELKTEWARFLALSLGILYMGKGEQVDDVLETISAIEHPMVSAIEVLVSSCAYTGTGDVLLIQDLLHRLTPKAVKKEDAEEAEDDDDDDDDDDEHAVAVVDEDVEGKEATSSSDPKHVPSADEDVAMEGTEEAVEANDTASESKNKVDKDTTGDDGAADGKTKSTKESKENDGDSLLGDELAYAVLGIAMIALGEGIGKEMSLRHFGHLMHYGNEHIRRMVPLAMGLVSIADPQMKVFETLSRSSHDPDLDVSMNSIFAMGLCGVGTNNARLAQLLRQLASYYSREQDALFMTRMAQGLLHMGKGTTTLDVFNDASVLNKVTLASLLTVLVGLSTPSFMIKHHQLFFMLNSGVRSKFIMTVDENGEPVKVNVRVGQAVDTVGQAGKPKTITGWITQSTPVLLNHGERAELETDKYISYGSHIEGIVVVRKNPDYQEEE